MLQIAVWVVFVAMAVSFARRKVHEWTDRQRLESAHPKEPWLWRRDWAERTSREAVHDRAWIPMLIAALVLALAVSDIRALLSGHLNLFGAVGAIMVVVLVSASVYVILRQRKYGTSVCRLDRVPIPPGGGLRGEVHSSTAGVPADGFDVGLFCIERVVRSSGKGEKVKETTLWREERKVAAGAVSRGLDGIRIPFRFDIPERERPSDPHDTGTRILWRLSVRADTAGIDYAADFELPVFRSA